MRAVLVEAPESLIEERRRKGHDRFDEMWEGVLHMVPAPSGPHQRLTFKLGAALLPLAEAGGMVISQDTGLYRPGVDASDYRVPDLLVARAEHATQRGVDGRAELAVEIRSPRDETYAKLGFYAEVGVQELLVVDRDTLALELFVLRGGTLHAALPDAEGAFRLGSLSLTVATVVGPVLRLTWPGGTAEFSAQI
jgi:Uma2 family endonuclease